MRTFVMLCLFFALLFGGASAEEDACTLTAPVEVRGFQENLFTWTAGQPGVATLSLVNGLGRECARPADALPFEAGETSFVWDGLGANEEQLQAGSYTLNATFAMAEGIVSVHQPIRVGKSRQAVLFALSSGKTLYLDGGLPWYTEVRLVRTGTLHIDFYRDGELIAAKRKEIGNYRVLHYDWDGRIDGKRQPAGMYTLHFYSEASPEIVREVQVELVDAAYTPPELAPQTEYLPGRDATDEEIWDFMQQPLTVVQIKSTAHQTVYAAPDRDSRALGTLHGQSQGVQVLEVRTDGWVRIGAYTHEEGRWTEGYVPAERLTTLPAQGDYGLLLDKQTQTLTVFFQGKRLAELKVSTGLPEPGKPEQETAAGAFFTLEHMSDFSMNGNNYDYVIRFDGGNLLHQCAYRMKKGWKDFSQQEAVLGQKASHGCVRIQRAPGEEGINAYWLWTHLPSYTKVLVLEGTPAGAQTVQSGQNGGLPDALTPPPLEPGDMELTLTVGGDVVLGTREKWQDSPEGLPAYLAEYGMAYPFQHLAELFAQDDMTMVNLECVLKDNAKNMTRNKQYIFRGATAYTEVLQAASIEQVNLANNHIIDYQEAGKESTRAALDEAGIAYSGYGDCYVWDYNGHKIGFAGCRETTYKKDPGVIAQDVETLRAAQCEVIVYSCHWGTEYDPAHNALQEEMAQTAAAAGVDIVIGTHPHVVQGVENREGTAVLYSLGNLMFGGTHDMTTFDGALARLRLRFDLLGRYQGVTVELLPVLTSSSGDMAVNNFAPVQAQGEDWARIWGKIQADTPFRLAEEIWFPAAK